MSLVYEQTRIKEHNDHQTLKHNFHSPVGSFALVFPTYPHFKNKNTVVLLKIRCKKKNFKRSRRNNWRLNCKIAAEKPKCRIIRSVIQVRVISGSLGTRLVRVTSWLGFTRSLQCLLALFGAKSKLQSSMPSSLLVKTVVRGYHVYKVLWEPRGDEIGV